MNVTQQQLDTGRFACTASPPHGLHRTGDRCSTCWPPAPLEPNTKLVQALPLDRSTWPPDDEEPILCYDARDLQGELFANRGVTTGRIMRLFLLVAEDVDLAYQAERSCERWHISYWWGSWDELVGDP